MLNKYRLSTCSLRGTLGITQEANAEPGAVTGRVSRCHRVHCSGGPVRRPPLPSVTLLLPLPLHEQPQSEDDGLSHPKARCRRLRSVRRTHDGSLKPQRRDSRGTLPTLLAILNMVMRPELHP